MARCRARIWSWSLPGELSPAVLRLGDEPNFRRAALPRCLPGAGPAPVAGAQPGRPRGFPLRPEFSGLVFKLQGQLWIPRHRDRIALRGGSAPALPKDMTCAMPAPAARSGSRAQSCSGQDPRGGSKTAYPGERDRP